MTDEAALEILSKCTTLEELQEKARELGVCRAFFNIGSTRDLDEKQESPE